MRILILLPLLGPLCALEADKREHALAGAAIGATAYAATAIALPESAPLQRFLIASLAATATGWAKEAYDRQGHGQYEARDAWMTALGGASAGGVLLCWDWSF